MIRHATIAACLLAAVLWLSPAPQRAIAASDTPTREPAVPARQTHVDDNDDTRVEVQIVVLGIALGTVFVVGTGVFLLRRKLGLVAPPPDPESGGHH